jgi:hypothetical protein
MAEHGWEMPRETDVIVATVEVPLPEKVAVK